MGRKLTVLYDAACNLCCSTVTALQRLPTRAELHFVPLQEADADALPPGTRKEELLAELHVVDEAGCVYKGAAGVVEIIKTVPMLAWMAWICRLPGMKGFADVLYRRIAKHRYRLFGQAETCRTGACFPERGRIRPIPEKDVGNGKGKKNT